MGQYEKLRGTAIGELDPIDPHNAVIIDAGNARRNASGKLEYSMDVFILELIDLSKGNRRVLFDLNNRGLMRLGRRNQRALANDPTTAADAGDGCVMRQGYAIVSAIAGTTVRRAAPT